MGSRRQLDLADVMGQIVKRVLGLRDKFGTGRRILIQRLDVKSAFRQVGVDPQPRRQISGTGGVHICLSTFGCSSGGGGAQSSGE